MVGLRLALIGVSAVVLAACGDGRGASAAPPPLAPEPGESAGAAGSGPSCEGSCSPVEGGGGAGVTPAENESTGVSAAESPPVEPSAGAGGADGSSAGAAGTGAAAEPMGPLPDLVLDAAYLIDTTIEDTIETDDACLMNEGCITGLGERRVVRFGSRTGNVGTADFLLGRPEAGNPYWTYDACHETFDLVGFALYELIDASTGTLVLTGVKNGFCIRDSEPWELEGGPSCRSFDCNGQGIGQGCADNYGSELQCQWVDITGVAAGAYTLRVTVNASRNIAELDYANNVVTVNLEISDDEVRVVP